jgi:hypothetical protein
VVEDAVAGKLTVVEAAELLQLSERQVKRLKRRHRPETGEWIHYDNRGRSPGQCDPGADAGEHSGTGLRKVRGIQRFSFAGETRRSRRNHCEQVECAAHPARQTDPISAETAGAEVSVAQGAAAAGRHDGADRCQPS